MPQFGTALKIAIILVVITLCGWGTASAEAGRRLSQVGVDFGWAQPYGDLAQDYTSTDLGFGAGEALQLGFFWRYPLSGNVSLSPAFHFVDYGDFSGVDETIGDFRIATSSLRYTLELLLIRGSAGKGARPFLAFSGGLYRDRVVGFTKGRWQPFDRSVNSLGFGVRAGVQLGDFEFSADYSVDRFSTWQYFRTGEAVDYNWDNFAVRVGWLIPFTD